MLCSHQFVYQHLTTDYLNTKQAKKQLIRFTGVLGFHPPLDNKCLLATAIKLTETAARIQNLKEHIHYNRKPDNYSGLADALSTFTRKIGTLERSQKQIVQMARCLKSSISYSIQGIKLTWDNNYLEPQAPWWQTITNYSCFFDFQR